jgi:SM-20-related protein
MIFEKQIQELIEKNWTTIEQFLTPKECENLIGEFVENQLEKAKVGSGQNRILAPEIRNDSIKWIQNDAATNFELEYLAKMQEIQSIINRELFLGLKEFECHKALYKNGEHYSKHTDQFKGNNSRTVTVITYLNSVTDGGELIIYNKSNPDLRDKIIKPQTGLLVCFLSDQLYHEVLPTKENRYSLTGWFKNSIS